MHDPSSLKRFGTVATELGLLTPVQLYEALKRQVEDVLTGKARRPIGQILREMGLLTAEQVAYVAIVQRRSARVGPFSDIPVGDPAAPWPLLPLPVRPERASASSTALEDR